VGVLTDRCRSAGRDTVSLWAPVPHYVANPPNPPATRALLQRLASVAGLPLTLDGLDQISELWRAQVDRALGDNDEMLAYVRELEARYDADHAGAGDDPAFPDGPIPSADELVDEVEQFLREQGGTDG
jgi:hypothetical protein